MTEQEFKEALKGKLDNEQAFRALWAKVSIYPPDDSYTMPDRPPRMDVLVGEVYPGHPYWRTEVASTHAWWWNREQLRICLGVYPPRSDVLTHVVRSFALGAYCVHPSSDPENPAAISYTPDAQFGQQDRQLKLSSLAKLIKKLCILVTDDHAQKLEAMHRAEMDPSFELATSALDVQDVYQNMDGDSGCMRHDPCKWELGDDVHPSHVYADVPGMGVAYHRVGDAIKSRAVVWETPTGEKHYLRIYGDGALKRKLERSGYTLASLAGARIRVVRALDEDNDEVGDTYVVPYIDGMGGNQDNSDGTYGYIDKDDPDFIQMVTRARAQALDRAGITVNQFKQHSSVTYRLYPQDLSALKFTCPITGVEADRTSDQTLKVYYRGKAVRVLHTPDNARRFGQRRADVLIGYDWHNLGIESYHKTFRTAERTCVIDDERHRLACGHVRLDATLYPHTTWTQDSGTAVLQDGRRVLKGDTLTVYDEGDARHCVLKSETSPSWTRRMVKAGYSPAGRGDSRYLVHEKHNEARVLWDGRVVHARHHDLRQLWDGTYAFDTQAVYSVHNEVPYYRVGADKRLPPGSWFAKKTCGDMLFTDANALEDYLQRAYGTGLDRARQISALQAVLDQMLRGLRFSITAQMVDGAWVWDYHSAHPDQISARVREVAAVLTDEMLAATEDPGHRCTLEWMQALAPALTLVEDRLTTLVAEQEAERLRVAEAERQTMEAESRRVADAAREMLLAAREAGLDVQRYGFAADVISTTTN